MSVKEQTNLKRLQWRLECLGHSLIEVLAGLLPGALVFHLGEALGGVVWYLLPRRRQMILRNLRIAFAGEQDLPELRALTKATFRRTSGNLLSAAHTARLAPERLGEVIQIDNLELLEQAFAGGKGVVILLAHMGNWEILSRIVHFSPAGSKVGAFYRPLNNKLLDDRILARRQADGTRMFSKSDNPLQVAKFVRDGGIVGILADQRVGTQGEVASFFGRLTRASPLPSLLARRAKCPVLAMAVTTVRPGKWLARFLPVDGPPTTANCMLALEHAMGTSPVDVFWFQERWKVLCNPHYSISDWLGTVVGGGGKAHRALLWLADAPAAWHLPAQWAHPDVNYEVVLTTWQQLPAWLPATIRAHRLAAGATLKTLRQAIRTIDLAESLPVDYILTTGSTPDLVAAARLEGIPLIALPAA